MVRRIAIACLLAVWSIMSLGQSNEPEANPARPTVATPATLPPVGYLQFETGVLYAEDSLDFSGRTSLVQVTKIAVHPRLEFFVTSEPVVYSGSNGARETDAGDVLPGVQGVLLSGKGPKPTIAVSYVHHLFHGTAPDLDMGTPENGVLLLGSMDLHGFHFDINGMFNELIEEKVRRAQWGHTVSISHPLPKKFTLAGELWRFTQPFQRGNAVGNLWALSYQAKSTLVFDAGFNHGLTSTSTQWEVFAGFTYLLPHRLWKSSEPKEPPQGSKK
jgi:hypothetical protein